MGGSNVFGGELVDHPVVFVEVAGESQHLQVNLNQPIFPKQYLEGLRRAFGLNGVMGSNFIRVGQFREGALSYDVKVLFLPDGCYFVSPHGVRQVGPNQPQLVTFVRQIASKGKRAHQWHRIFGRPQDQAIFQCVSPLVSGTVDWEGAPIRFRPERAVSATGLSSSRPARSAR